MENTLEEHLRRLRYPDGDCVYCGYPANQHYPVGPITVTVATPDDGDEFQMREFCEWRCFARWAAQQAGGDYVDGGAR